MLNYTTPDSLESLGLLILEVKSHSVKQRLHPIIAQMLCRLPSNRSTGCISWKQRNYFKPPWVLLLLLLMFLFMPSKVIYTVTCLVLHLHAFGLFPWNDNSPFHVICTENDVSLRSMEWYHMFTETLWFDRTYLSSHCNQLLFILIWKSWEQYGQNIDFCLRTSF